jgi:REP element-mobilizing transposase RayT
VRPNREPATNNGQTYVVTSSTWSRRALFRAEPWAKLFLETLYYYRGNAYQLHAFVLMPDHFHVLITPEATLERAAQCIKGGFSHSAKVELGSKIEIWQKGFSDHNPGFPLDPAPQRLKPLARAAACGAAEAAPFQKRTGGDCSE